MLQRQLSVVTYAILVSRILYALPAWGGFLSAELIGRINAFFRHAKRFGYIDTVLTVDELLSQSEYDLFVKATLYIICFPISSLLFYYKIVHVVQNNEKKIHETIKNKGNMQEKETYIN